MIIGRLAKYVPDSPDDYVMRHIEKAAIRLAELAPPGQTGFSPHPCLLSKEWRERKKVDLVGAAAGASFAIQRAAALETVRTKRHPRYTHPVKTVRQKIHRESREALQVLVFGITGVGKARSLLEEDYKAQLYKYKSATAHPQSDTKSP